MSVKSNKFDFASILENKFGALGFVRWQHVTRAIFDDFVECWDDIFEKFRLKSRAILYACPGASERTLNSRRGGPEGFAGLPGDNRDK